jgi:hypothetical protein
VQCVWKTRHVKLVKYLEPQEYYISLSRHFLRNVSTSSTYLFRYIGVNYPKGRSPEVWYISSIYIYIYMCVCVCVCVCVWQLPPTLARNSILWNSKCHNPVQKRLQLVYILRLINSINAVPFF